MSISDFLDKVVVENSGGLYSFEEDNKLVLVKIPQGTQPISVIDASGNPVIVRSPVYNSFRCAIDASFPSNLTRQAGIVELVGDSDLLSIEDIQAPVQDDNANNDVVTDHKGRPFDPCRHATKKDGTPLLIAGKYFKEL